MHLTLFGRMQTRLNKIKSNFFEKKQHFFIIEHQPISGIKDKKRAKIQKKICETLAWN